MPFFVSDLDEDKGLFKVSCCICEEWYHKNCENVNVSVFKDDKKAQQWMCKGCKKKNLQLFYIVLDDKKYIA